MFDRFYKADTSYASPGTGLGLSIAQAIVTEHKGRIWAESSGGVNIFSVQLPALPT